jgi:hypothetical protein
MDVARSPEQAMSAALLATTGAATLSHRSAAWLWGLVEDPSPQVELIVPRSTRAELKGVHLYRPRDAGDLHVVRHRHLYVTNPLRTLIDLATMLEAEQLDRAMDRGVASRLLPVKAIVAEFERRSKQGRPGMALARRRIEARGLVDVAHPSVLESMTHRFLRAINVGWLHLEVEQLRGRYRADVQLAPRALLEVDGYTHHWNPEAKAYDEERRRQIRRTGMLLEVLDFHQIRHRTKHAERVVLDLLADAGALPQQPRRR